MQIWGPIHYLFVCLWKILKSLTGSAIYNGVGKYVFASTFLLP